MASDYDGLIDRVLTGTTSLDGVSFSGATGVNWTQVALGAVGSFVVAYYTGFIAIVQSIASGLTDIVEGFGRFLSGGFVTNPGTVGDISSVEFLPGLLDVVVDLASAPFAMDMSQYGIIGYPVAVASVLAGFYVLSQTASWITGRYF